MEAKWHLTHAHFPTRLLQDSPALATPAYPRPQHSHAAGLFRGSARFATRAGFLSALMSFTFFTADDGFGSASGWMMRDMGRFPTSILFVFPASIINFARIESHCDSLRTFVSGFNSFIPKPLWSEAARSFLRNLGEKQTVYYSLPFPFPFSFRSSSALKLCLKQSFVAVLRLLLFFA